MRLALLALLSCGENDDPCLERADDADCDGVPNAVDECPDSPRGQTKDAVGCSEGQTAGCRVTVVAPGDEAVVSGEVLFRWAGNCDVYLLQFANDVSFPEAATRTAVRTTATEATATGDERFVRVVGGVLGGSSQAASDVRELEWASP